MELPKSEPNIAVPAELDGVPKVGVPNCASPDGVEGMPCEGDPAVATLEPGVLASPRTFARPGLNNEFEDGSPGTDVDPGVATARLDAGGRNPSFGGLNPLVPAGGVAGAGVRAGPGAAAGRFAPAVAA